MRGLTAAIIGLVAATGFAGTYTLEQLLSSGMSSSRQIRMVEEEMRKTDAQVAAAYGSALPRIDASVNLSHAFEQFSPFSAGGRDTSGSGQALNDMYYGMTMRYPDTAEAALIRRIGPVITGATVAQLLKGLDFSTPPNTMALSLQLTQPLFARGKVGIGLKIAKTYREGLGHRLEHTRDTVAASITKLFYAALLAQKNVQVQQETVTLANESHRLTVLRFAVGKGSELDTLTSRLALEKAIIDHRNTEGQLRTAYEALIKQTGIQAAPEQMNLSGEFPSEAYAITLNEAREKMRADNLVLKQLRTGERVQEYLVDIAKSDFYPMVFGGASISKIYQFDKPGDIDWAGGDDRKVFVGATWNLFDGFQKAQKVRQAQSDRRMFEQTRALASDGFEVGVRAAYEKLVSARTQLDQSQMLLSLAQKGYTISKTAYEIGQITLLDFQKRALDLDNAKLAMNAAQFAFHSAVVDLKVLTGEFERP